ncbi:MAG: uroporphyrinogen-III synthase, partial [Planctomycetia bacterium]|nr:uroporphyrinogen-III synthase [Planctomycetia bacterium]
FASSSRVNNFFSVVSRDQLRSWPAGKVRIASIGPSTSAAVRDAGFAPAVEATEYTIDGLVEAIVGQQVTEKELS